MIQQTYLGNQFLIAMPALADPNFFQTVTYLCEHTDQGAMGIIINRPLNLQLGELLEHLQIPVETSGIAERPLYAGGPVEKERGFVIHSPVGQWEATIKVTDTVGITTSRDILQALAKGEGPAQMLVALGYAGWGAGQLEQEIGSNAWLSGPADPRVLFHTPDEQRWAAAARLLGVDLSLLSGEAGHA